MSVHKIRAQLVLTLFFLSILGISRAAWAQKSLYKNSKVSKNLQYLYQKKLNVVPNTRSTLGPEVLSYRGNSWVIMDAIPQGTCEDLIRELESLGAIHLAYYGGLVSGLIPLDRIPEMEKCASLGFARQSPMQAGIGLVTSQGDAAFQADEGRDEYGVSGEGSKIGILSDSYNARGGASQGVSNGDLPGLGNPFGNTDPVDILLELNSPIASDEGRGMAELIHDVAPAAELAFASAFFGQANFAQSIVDLQNAGCNIIVDDILYFAEPMFQDGVIAQAVDQVSAAGVHYFSSAGNFGTSSYESEFRGAGPFSLRERNAGSFIGNFLLHDFDPGPGVDVFQAVTVSPGENLRLILQWDEPFASNCVNCPGSQNDVDIFIANSPDVNDIFLSISSLDGNLGMDPVEITRDTTVFGASPATFYILIGKFITGINTPDPGFIKYINIGADDSNKLEYGNNPSASYGHANAAQASGVGAAAFFNTPEFNLSLSSPLVNNFSSRGGVPIFFDVNGNRLSIPESRQTPDFVGPDGGNTSFFGNDSGADSDGFPNFFGTSASAPHVAAVAALINEVDNSLSPEAMRALLANTAQDMDDPLNSGFENGFDFRTGFGFVQALEALAQVSNPPNTSGIISLEAECATIGAAWLLQADPLASEGYYVVYDGPDSPNKTNATTGPRETEEDFIVQFDFQVSEAGPYFLFANSRTPTSNDDSFWLSVDGGEFKLWFQGFVRDENFNWVPYQAIGESNPLNLSVGSHTIRVLYRENGAQLDKIILSPEEVLPQGFGAPASNVCEIIPPSPMDELISLEAECATVGSNWVLKEDSRAAGGKYVVYEGSDSPNRKNASEGPEDVSPESRVSFFFDLAVGGTYDLFALVNTPSNQDDSFWISIDGGPFLLWFEGLIDEDLFKWVALQAVGQDNPLSLAAGSHRIDFLYRENGTILDKLILRQDGNLPTGFGEEAQNSCTIAGPQLVSLEAECANVGANWSILSSGEASNNTYVSYLSDDRDNKTSASNGPGDTRPESRVRFDFTLNEAGSFDLFVLARTPDNDADSYWIRIDEGPYRMWFEGFVDEPGFKWVPYQAIGDDNPISLAAGAHTIDILYRENGADLDKIILREDGNVPTDLGEPGQSLCTPGLSAAEASLLQIQAYPNPMQAHELRIRLSKALPGELTVEVMDLQEALIRRIPVRLETSQKELVLDLSGWKLPRGAYGIRVSNGQEISEVIRVWKAE